MDSRENIIEALLGKSTVARRKAAIAICKNNIENLCSHIIQALNKELELDHWETKRALVKAIGLGKCNGAEGVLRSIVFSSDSEQYDIVKGAAAEALIRISRGEAEILTNLREIFQVGGYSIVEGAFNALGYDKMIFEDKACQTIIEYGWDFGKERPKGYTDPRYGLAAACAGWNPNITRAFLQHCLESSDVPLNYVTNGALKGKYLKLR